MDMAQAHGVAADIPMQLVDAEQVARVMSALATASRVRSDLAHLRQGTLSVSERTAEVGMAQPAVSHQHRRILRDLGLVVGVRRGRKTVHGPYDAHVPST